MPIEIDHLGIAVPNLAEALAFYADVLGMTVANQETVSDGQSLSKLSRKRERPYTTRHESVPSEKVNVAMLPAGDGNSAPRIELLEPTHTDSVIAKFIKKRGPGLHHIALRVDDLTASVERLKSSGATLLNEPRQGAGGHLYVFVHPQSTGGVLIELIQR